MNQVIAIALKDIKQLVRDKAGLFWVIGFPIVMALFFGSIFGSEGQTAAMGVVVVDQDSSDKSKSFIASLRKSESLKVDEKPIVEAKELVRKGDRVAYVVIPKGFGEAPLFAPGDGAALEVGRDPKRKAEAGFLQGILTQAYFEQMQSTFDDPEAMKKQAAEGQKALAGATSMDPAQKEALQLMLGNLSAASALGGFGGQGGGIGMDGPQIKTVEVSREGQSPATAFEVTFPQGILWGLIAVVNTFALALVKERTMGTFQRLTLAPISRRQLLAGKGLACFLTSFFVTLGLLFFGTIVGVRTFSNPAALFLALVCSSICFVGLMMLISTFGKTENSVSGAGWGMMLVFSMIGGGMIPLIAMPQWMQTVSSASPVKWSITALEGAIWRGFTLTEMLLPCAVLVAVGAAGYGLGTLLLSRQKA